MDGISRSCGWDKQVMWMGMNRSYGWYKRISRSYGLDNQVMCMELAGNMDGMSLNKKEQQGVCL